jgi:hypothetical protein
MRVYGRKDAKDKKTQIERLLVIESTLREVHVTRTQADALTMQAVEASNAKLAAMLLDERQVTNPSPQESSSIGPMIPHIGRIIVPVVPHDWPHHWPRNSSQLPV